MVLIFNALRRLRMSACTYVCVVVKTLTLILNMNTVKIPMGEEK